MWRASQAVAVPELDEIASDIWLRLGAGRDDRRSPMRLPVIATVDEQGTPRARTVVLRHVDRNTHTIGFHTDARSPKLQHLQRLPPSTKFAIAWVFYDPEAKIQIRAETGARVHVGDDVARAVWDETPDYSRACYMVAQPPSSVLPTALDPADAVVTGSPPHDRSERLGWPNFAVVRCEVRRFEWLSLAASGHRRAQFQPGDAASARWLVP